MVAESLYSSWQQATKRYQPVSASDRAWLRKQLNKAKAYKLPVYVIDYSKPNASKKAVKLADKITADGFIPWISNGALNMLGRGSFAVSPRKVMVLYNQPKEFALDELDVFVTTAMPLEYLGYTPRYHPLNKQLPSYPLIHRYAGIIVWLNQASPLTQQTQRWLHQQLAAHIPILFMGDAPTAQQAAFFKPFGLRFSKEQQSAKTIKIQGINPSAVILSAP